MVSSIEVLLFVVEMEGEGSEGPMTRRETCEIPESMPRAKAEAWHGQTDW